MAGDSYSWIGGNGGSWNVASNWEDLTTGSVAAVAPGIGDSATISGPDSILGTASVGTLTVTGDYYVTADIFLATQILGDINIGTLVFAGSAALTASDGGTIVAGSVGQGFNNLYADSASVFEVGAAGTGAVGAVTIDPGATISSGGSVVGKVVDNGVITGDLSLGDFWNYSELVGSGTVEVQPGGTIGVWDQVAAGGLTFQLDGTADLFVTGGGSIGAGNTFDLLGDQNTLAISLLGGTPADDASITGFNTTDVLSLGIGPGGVPVTNESVSFSDGTLVETGQAAGITVTSTAYFASDYSGDTFFFADYGIMEAPTTNVACFAGGTVIETPSGGVPIEDLREGDPVLTVFAGQQPVCWVGYRSVDCRRHPASEQVRPVRIQAGALGEGMPRSDLLLSPDHAVFTDGMLIPIKHLINGTSIAQVSVDTVTYYHLELPNHDVLLANGLPTESYLDTGDRAGFANGGTVADQYPNFALSERREAIWEAAGCAPLRLERPDGAVIVCDMADLVDPAWYLAANPDVAAAGVDAVGHYVRWGRQEGRLPREAVSLIRSLGLIDPGTVVFTMADVVDAGLDPVEHFCELGWREARRPNPYFDTGWYRNQYNVPVGINPLLHYVVLGETRGLRPSRHFDPAWYRECYGIDATVSALAHYLVHRRTQEFSPLPTFDVGHYVRTQKSGLRRDGDAYLHALVMGLGASEFRKAA
jgi:hypothetical protein